MSLPNLAFGPEWAILELLCLGLTNSEQQEMFEELIKSRKIDWGELIEQALSHRMLPLLALHLTTDELKEFSPRFVGDHLRLILDNNRHKTTIFRQAAVEVINALESLDVKFVGTKGIVFEGTLYAGNGSRNFKRDIDFMISSKDRDVVIEGMKQLGYKMGHFNWKTNTIKPHDRKEMLIYQMSPDHIPDLSKLTKDPIVKFMRVDFANSLTWTGCSFDIPLEDAFLNILHQPIIGHSKIMMPIFAPFFQFTFTILHLFREAWFDKWFSLGQDVNLSKFADVIRLWCIHKEQLVNMDFTSKLSSYGAQEPILWVLEHLDRTFHTGIVAALGLEGQVSESWLASARASGGKLRYWQGTMRERLHIKERQEIFINS